MNHALITRGLRALATGLCLSLLAATAAAKPDPVRKAIADSVENGTIDTSIADALKAYLEPTDGPPRGTNQPTLDFDGFYNPDPGINWTLIEIIDAEADFEGNIILYGEGQESNTYFRAFVLKIDQAGILKWTHVEDRGTQPRDAFNQIAIDLDSNVHILFRDRNTDQSLVSKLNTENGNLLWRRQLSGYAPDIAAGRMLVDQDGNIYIIGSDALNTPFIAPVRVQRLTPDGFLYYQRDITLPGSLDLYGTNLDRFGNLYVYNRESGGRTVLTKMAASGDIAWTRTVDGPGSDAGVQPSFNLVIDTECNTYLVARETGAAGTYDLVSYDSNGELRYRSRVGAGTPTGSANPKVALTRDQCVYVAYPDSQEMWIDKFDAMGNYAGGRNTDFLAPGAGTVKFASLAVDRFGNPYLLGDGERSNGTAFGTVLKMNKEGLGTVWFEIIENTVTQDTYQDLLIDFGDNIYFTGQRMISGLPPFNFGRAGKLSQPYVSIPTIATNSANLQIQDQSLWTEGAGSVTASQNFFSLTPGQTAFNITRGDSFNTVIAGEFGAEVNFGGSVGFSAGFRATASGGSADIIYPGDLDLAIPGAEKLFLGAPFDIGIKFKPNSSARIIADTTPELSAALTGDIAVTINSGAQVEAFSSIIGNPRFVDFSDSWSGDIPGFGVSFPTGSPGQWIEYGNTFVSAKAKRPQFAAAGGLNVADGSAFSVLEPEVFFELTGNLTDTISQFTLGTPLSYGLGPSVSSSEFGIGASIGIAQAKVTAGLEANQVLGFTPSPTVTFNFNIPMNINNAPGGPLTGVTSYTVALPKDGGIWKDTLSVTVPISSQSALLAQNGVVSIKPEMNLPGTMDNDTWVDIKPSFSWSTLEAGASITAAGYDLLSFEFCAGCFDIPIADDVKIPIFNNAFAVNPLDAEPDFPLDPIKFFVDPDGQPEITGASRPGLTAFLYDQVSPDPFDLAVFANQPGKKMLIYGDKFFGPGEGAKYPIDDFVLCLGGRVMPLNWTKLNTRTASVEIPNEMRIVPGVGRIWAVDANGMAISESFDLPITLPAPNLATAGPSLWAGDPRVGNLAIDVIDGLTAGGEPSFIARRDYWYVLRQLWTDAFSGSRGDLFSLYADYTETGFWAMDPPMPSVSISRQNVGTLPGAEHAWDFDGFLNDSIRSANLQPGALAGDEVVFVSEGVPEFLEQAILLQGFLDIAFDTDDLTPFGTGDFSVAFWVRRLVLGGAFDYVFDAEQGGSGYSIAFNNDRPSLEFIDSSGTPLRLTAAAQVLDQEWHHFAVTVDRNDPNGCRWYIDGVLDAELDPTARQGSIGLSAIAVGYFGREFESTAADLDGELADFTIYNRALSPAEALELSRIVVDTPLPKFKQPVENGILYSLMPSGEYDEPGTLDIRLRTAGPGGGTSGSVSLTVAAPKPAIFDVTPRTVIPGAGDQIITVDGPLSVPYFLGFEQERFGNFNRASVVLYDGIQLETTYVSPGTLRATIPAGLTAMSGNAQISVMTPSNGTSYFDSFANDGAGGFTPSGGESNWIPFSIRFPNPMLSSVSPDYACACTIDRCPDMPEQLKVQVRGKDIYPGAAIWINGTEYTTFLQDAIDDGIGDPLGEVIATDSVLYTFLDPEDLQVLGSAGVVVINPDGYASNTLTLEIVDETTYEMLTGMTLPPAFEPGQPCE